MLKSVHKIGGRAFAVVVWCIGLATIVAMALLLIWVQTPVKNRDWAALAQILGGYFIMVGIIGGAAQAGNAAERLPGVRRFEGQYRGHGQTERASDRDDITEEEK